MTWYCWNTSQGAVCLCVPLCKNLSAKRLSIILCCMMVKVTLRERAGERIREREIEIKVIIYSAVYYPRPHTCTHTNGQQWITAVIGCHITGCSVCYPTMHCSERWVLSGDCQVTAITSMDLTFQITAFWKKHLHWLNKSLFLRSWTNKDRTTPLDRYSFTPTVHSCRQQLTDSSGFLLNKSLCI